MIDLHTHTTASDGSCSPEDLVERVVGAGIQTFAVADHDTVSAVPDAMRLARRAGIECVPAVEITAVYHGKDVHVLGYFLDPRARSLLTFLDDSRTDRLRRARVMCERLSELGAPVDFDALVARSGGPNSGKAIARPLVAKALLEAGHVQGIQEAFDRFLSEGQPAFCPRVGASPADVVRVITAAGGIASLAHPGPLGRDELIDALVEDGLAAIECFHSDHDGPTTDRYLAMARRLGLAVTGGSDFHGPAARRAEQFGRVSLPSEYYQELIARAAAAAAR